MSLRCGCKDEGDEIVFGPIHQCTAEPVLRSCGCGYDVRHMYGCCPVPGGLNAEPRYMETLDEDERRGH